MTPLKIYFAGPLFTWGEREQNKQIVAILRDLGHEVFLPQESEQKNNVTPKGIFDSDMEGLNWSNVVVGCMDGPDPDSGTCFEVGNAYGKKWIVLYRTDIREEGPPLGPYNLMMHARADAVLDCKWMIPDEIAAEINAALAKLAGI